MNQLSDEAIVGRILQGEAHLYENLIRKYNQRLYRISLSIVEDDQEAEDVMQIAYINAFRQLENFRQQCAFGTWLTRILINESCTKNVTNEQSNCVWKQLLPRPTMKPR